MMAINMQFTDRNIDGFKFGQMTMTGYKYIVVLDKDFPEQGWHEGDMLAISMENHPCFRIEPLFGVKVSSNHCAKLSTLKHTDSFVLEFPAGEKSES